MSFLKLFGLAPEKKKPARRENRAKPAPRAKTRPITHRIEKPVDIKDKFYLRLPVTCAWAWDMAGTGIYEMAADSVPEDEICRKTGMSLYDVRRAIAAPWYRQVDTQSDGRRTIALYGWDEHAAIPDECNWQHLYVTPDDIARHTGLIHDPERYIIRWDAGACTHFATLPVYNPQSENFGNFFARRAKAVKRQPDEYRQQVQKLARFIP